MLTSTYLKSFFRDRHARDDDVQPMRIECRNQTVKRLKDEFAISIQRRAEQVADDQDQARGRLVNVVGRDAWANWASPLSWGVY